ncbi:hypothetical protein HS088_TW23G00594 [Tripterygium wilfordii]|uniref:Myb/SANT-like domain-containing protein n=1 Tax=Tripterygium wilfordii TaxID=458696 RepID=A0A7J7BVI7_TRIWF|nr:hypothetical protein HS088_TW23G00594 [Tripterygium wilfordii]
MLRLRLLFFFFFFFSRCCVSFVAGGRELKEAFEFADMSRKRKDKMATYKGSENERVKWDDANTRVLVEMCVAVMKAAKRVPGSRIPKLEWEELVVQFNAKTGLSYQKKSLKSKWDLLRKDWTLWAKMTARDTDIGWNDSKQTIDASDEWWEERIKVHVLFVISTVVY